MIDALGGTKTVSDLGLMPIHIDDHNSGRHHPDGSLTIHPSSHAHDDPPRIGCLEFDPALLDFFGVPRPDGMAEPSFEIR